MKTIEKGNILIAEFLGCYKYPENSFDNVWSYEIYGRLDFVDDGEHEKHYYLPSEMKFHKSWDWLMPVIKEISNKTGYVYVMYGTDSYFTNMGDSFYFGGGFESIEETHIAVVQFIEWYNRLTDET